MRDFLATHPGDGGGGGTRYTWADTGLDEARAAEAGRPLPGVLRGPLRAAGLIRSSGHGPRGSRPGSARAGGGRCGHLVVDLVQVEVVAPPGDQPVGVHVDHRAPVDLDGDGAPEGPPADPLEGPAARRRRAPR